MTRQHFEALASSIKQIIDPAHRLSAAFAVASVCRGFNAAFDTDRFMKACGVTK